ncbi:head GIN domain-containing protein [Mucilaginibacter antarcticus]|uniref:Head GIN domain-containing protein n=1 Tax=Mucilaginibacter antarcticus TaxID=1855725 RepID=A0ABW5XMF2_9SPHI
MKLSKTFITLLLFTAGNVTLAKANKVDRHLSSFHAVNVAGSFDVVIKQGSTESVVVDAPADVINYVITEVSNGSLKIYTRNNQGWKNLFSNKRIVVYVNIKTVDAISLTGSGDVSFKDGVTANLLKLALTGSGNVMGKITAKSLDASITGSGDVNVWGHANDSKVSITGSGDYSGDKLTTASTSASIGGSGDITVHASENLQARISGSGDIHYSGNPKNVIKSKSGSGDISSN